MLILGGSVAHYSWRRRSIGETSASPQLHMANGIYLHQIRNDAKYNSVLQLCPVESKVCAFVMFVYCMVNKYCAARRLTLVAAHTQCQYVA